MHMKLETTTVIQIGQQQQPAKFTVRMAAAVMAASIGNCTLGQENGVWDKDMNLPGARFS